MHPYDNKMNNYNKSADFPYITCRNINLSTKYFLILVVENNSLQNNKHKGKNDRHHHRCTLLLTVLLLPRKCSRFSMDRKVECVIG